MTLDKRNVIWVASPPPSKRNGHRITGRPIGGEYPFWETLRTRPMKWAIIPVDERTAGIHRKHRPDFEFAVRSGKVYCRYLGEKK